MTLAGKRKVIEVLLSCGDVGNPNGTGETATALGYARRYQHAAFDAWDLVNDEPMYMNEWSADGVARAYTEAAYRLIESSPTLRREWFGTR